MAADMEIGRRHPYLHSWGGAVAGLGLVVLAGLVALAGVLVWPEAVAAAFRAVGWAAVAVAGLWLFWWVGLRRR
ncbi:MAG TPA: hypothetical protein VFX60_19250 [Micromonospora sp.]|nr:hypothetical protein [Micromonospora sp.]